MSKLTQYFKRNLMFPVLGVVVGAAAAGVYVSSEIDRDQYGIYTSTWDKANTHTQSAIREAMSDGFISYWESVQLNRLIMDDVRVITFCTGACDETTIDESKAQLVELLNK